MVTAEQMFGGLFALTVLTAGVVGCNNHRENLREENQRLRLEKQVAEKRMAVLNRANEPVQEQPALVQDVNFCTSVGDLSVVYSPSMNGYVGTLSQGLFFSPIEIPNTPQAIGPFKQMIDTECVQPNSCLVKATGVYSDNSDVFLVNRIYEIDAVQQQVVLPSNLPDSIRIKGDVVSVQRVGSKRDFDVLVQFDSISQELPGTNYKVGATEYFGTSNETDFNGDRKRLSRCEPGKCYVEATLVADGDQPYKFASDLTVKKK